MIRFAAVDHSEHNNCCFAKTNNCVSKDIDSQIFLACMLLWMTGKWAQLTTTQSF